jgi:NAD(P)-dependent dehydrogenase (short-subunit alcohol dehydrogenase family)
LSQFENKTAVISGGAEGIGFGVAKAMGKQGMNIVLGDIDEAQLAVAEAQLQKLGIPVLAVKMDVTDRAQWQNLAEQAIARFGKIHMLLNNAGVSSKPGSIEATNHKDWNWVLDVNLMGVVTGTEIMVPYMKQHGEGGWLVNVASMAGVMGIPYAGAYTATKVAVVGMSEAWQVELERHNIHVAVLCPAFVKTRIHLSHRNRQEHHKIERPENSAKKSSGNNPAQALVENGIPADLVGERVVEALNAGELYIFTHPSHRDAVKKRSDAIDAAFARAAQSPLVGHVIDEAIVGFE